MAMEAEDPGVAALLDGTDVRRVNTTAERVVDAIRDLLIEGRITPGTRLSEEEFAGALGVSRNTLREAFRILVHEGLLVHEVNRGVFVRKLTEDDVHNIYALRRIIEPAVVSDPSTHTPERIQRLRDAVDRGYEAQAAGDWVRVGTSNMRFHSAIAALAGNELVNSVMSRVLAQLRLTFHVMTPLEEFHAPYLPTNRRIQQLIEAGECFTAAATLTDYLCRAEEQLVTAYRRL